MNEKEYKDKDPVDYSDEYIRYGLITRKGEERSLDDTYMTFSDLESDDKKSFFSLFGIFDGHNNDYVSKYLSKNIHELFKKEIANINNNNYKTKIEDIFKIMDKKIKEEEEQKEKNTINEIEKSDNKSEIKENKKYINVGVDEKEIKYFKDLVKNSKEIPEDLKEIEDSQIKDLLLFRNLFKYNNNYLYNNNDVDYIGSSASVVLINDVNVITANLGITACILFNKNGEIKNLKDSNNNTKDLYELRNEHTFNNKEEKRRIKKFNQEIDYNKLKLNIYVPASRCFGLFKYKRDEILKEENQIISCVPDVRKFDKNEIDFILLMTKGMIDLIGDNLKQLVEKIVNTLKEPKNNETKLSKIIEEYIKQTEIENEKKSVNNHANNLNNNINKLPLNKVNSSIYVGKDDFAEENVIINELNNNYYKDIMNINKMNDPSFNGKSNMTCILIQLLKSKKKVEKKDTIEIVEDNKKEEKKIEKQHEQLENDNVGSAEKIKEGLKNDEKKEKEILEKDKRDEKINKEKEEIENKKEENNINKNGEVNNDIKNENKMVEDYKKDDFKKEGNKTEEIQKDKNNNENEENKVKVEKEIKNDIESKEGNEVKNVIKKEEKIEDNKNGEKEKEVANILKNEKEEVDSLKNNDKITQEKKEYN